MRVSCLYSGRMAKHFNKNGFSEDEEEGVKEEGRRARG
jgi:hypothetical protein